MNVPRNTRKLLGLHLTGDLGPFTIYTSRRAGTVWFTKAPPTSPPTIHQIRNRDRFRLAAKAWNALPQGTRDAWNLACLRAHLYVHGYNLWVWWQILKDRPYLRTIERHSRIQLLP